MCFYQSCEGCVATEQELYSFLQMLGMNHAMHTSRIYFETVPSLSWRQITCFGFILQFGPPGIYQPGQITDRAVLNVYGGLSEWRADGYLLDKYQVRILVFFFFFALIIFISISYIEMYIFFIQCQDIVLFRYIPTGYN